MRYFLIAFLSLFFRQVSHAELILLPDNCFSKKITPCLVRALNDEGLYDQTTKILYNLSENTIIKWTGFGDQLTFDILEGQVKVISQKKNLIEMSVNKIKFSSNALFVRRKEFKLDVFNTNQFVLSEYDLAQSKESDSVIARSDFPTKANMIEFISEFYENKKELIVFLKNIEEPWQKEFNALTERQTKVLQRSVASVENFEKEKKLKKIRDEEELKKVRDLFFYRTFYR